MQEKRTNSAGFGNGFLLGMIVGGAIIFLLCTKMGRRILKELSENGLSALDSIDKLADPEKIQKIIDQERMSGIDTITAAPHAHATNGHHETKEHSSSKRFFKGAKRRN